MTKMTIPLWPDATARELLRILAQIADDPNADTAVRGKARQALEKWLVRLKELGQDSTLSRDVRRELEDTIRKFRHS
jgi:uncharacterized protein (UPF0147 family)